MRTSSRGTLAAMRAPKLASSSSAGAVACCNAVSIGRTRAAGTCAAQHPGIMSQQQGACDGVCLYLRVSGLRSLDTL